MSRIYVASSWRNEYQPAIVERLKTIGHEVYDFRNPEPGNNGFRWSDVSVVGEHMSARQYREALKHPLAARGFGFDKAAMEWADTGLLLLPSGRSAHLELGWMAGRGKRTIILTEDGQPPELMALLATRVCIDMDEVERVLLSEPSDYLPTGYASRADS